MGEARDEVIWMVYEIKRLREENAEFKSFVDNFRDAMEEEFKDK